MSNNKKAKVVTGWGKGTEHICTYKYSQALESIIHDRWAYGVVRTWTPYKDKRGNHKVHVEFTNPKVRIVKVSIDLNQYGIRALTRPGLIMAFISTDQGILRKEECIQRGLGGRLLFVVVLLNL